jgi:hypothetical protein
MIETLPTVTVLGVTPTVEELSAAVVGLGA